MKNWSLNVKSKKNNIHFAASNAFVMLVSFLLMPLILTTYGIEYLGIFSLIISLNSIVPLLDLGFSNALANEINRFPELRYVKRERTLMGLHFLFIPGIIFISIGIFSTIKISNIYEMIQGALNLKSLRILIILMTVHSIMLVIFNTASKIRIARNELKRASNVLVLNSLVILIASVLAIILSHNFFFFICIYILSSWIVNLTYLPRTIQGLKLSRKNDDIEPVTALSRIGYISGSATFFAIQLSAIISYQIDNLIIVKYFSLTEVALYSTALKFVSFPIAILASYSLPLWTHTSSGKFGTNKFEIFTNLKTILRKRILLAIPFGLLFFIVLPNAIRIWSNGEIDLPPFLTFWLVLWMIISILIQPIAMVTNGMFFQKFILISGAFGAIINLFVSVILCMKFNLLAGPVIGSITAQLLSSLIPFLVISRILKSRGEKNFPSSL